MLYLALADVRIDWTVERPLPEDELARLREEYRRRVNAGPQTAHARLLHPALPGHSGKVSLMRVTTGRHGEERWETRVVTLDELPGSDALLWATHVGMQRFYGARGSSALAQVQALICDLDCHDKPRFRGISPEEMAGVVIERIEAAGLPLPSYILFSGRGLHVVWLHEPHAATPEFMTRWRAVQRALHGPKGGVPVATVRTATGTRLQDPDVLAREQRMADLWRGTGLDRGACDTARVLRLAGTYNAKSGQVARLVWPSSWTDVVRHDYEDLANAFLPMDRFRLREVRAERHAAWEGREAARQARRAEAEASGSSPAEDKPRRRRGGRWAEVFDALDAMRVWWGGTPPEGRRDWWAFLSACALAHAEGGDAAGWAARLAPLAGLPEDELRTSLGALERLLRRHEAGETSERDGVERPALYTYRGDTMLARLGLSEEDAEDAGAHALLPRGRRRSERERSAARRVEAGATPRTVTVDARLADGHQALALRASGRTMPEIVRAFAGRRGETSLRRAMRDAAASVADAPDVHPVDSAEGQSIEALHNPTSPIVVLPGGAAPWGEAPARPARFAIPSAPVEAVRPIPVQASPPIVHLIGVGWGSGEVSEGLLAASPGRCMEPPPLPTEEELPDFLRLLAGHVIRPQVPATT